MRVVFMGTPEFAVPSLRMLADAHEVVAVYTRPDAVSRRGTALIPPPVKQLAVELGIDVRQPSTLRGGHEAQHLASLSLDVICVAAYGLLLPSDVLAVPRFGCVNVHASLLPRHRGAAPIHRAVLEGDEVVGVSIMRMEEGLDTGPYALQRSISADALTVAELTARLAEEGAGALIEVLALIEAGAVRWTPQDACAATYAAKVTRADVALSPGLTVSESLRRVRASTPQAPSRVEIAGTLVTVISAARSDLVVTDGLVSATPRELVLGVSDGALRLERIRPAGKQEMDGGAWACGARLGDQCQWGAPQ